MNLVKENSQLEKRVVATTDSSKKLEYLAKLY